MDEKVRAFIDANNSAAMITLRPDGTPHAARISLAVIDGKLWSSATQKRLRTRYLRRDPRCTLFVFGEGPWYLSLETRATILDGPEAPDQNLRLFRSFQPQAAPGTIDWFGRTLTYDEFRDFMVEDQRIIYEFEVLKAYGLPDESALEMPPERGD